MAVEQEQTSSRRRRAKSNVWFDHGYVSIFEESQASDWKGSQFGKSVSLTVRLLWTLLKLVLLTFLATISIGILLRIANAICSTINTERGLCSNALIKPHPSTLASLRKQTTPTTKTINHLTKLNNFSPQLEFVGFATHLTMANLTQLYPLLEDQSNTLSLSQSDLTALATAANTAQEIIEQLSNEDYHYRHNNLLFHQNGLLSLNETLDLFANELSTKNRFSQSLWEQVYARMPYGGRWTLTYSLLNSYSYFLGEQWLHVESLVKTSAETSLVLGQFHGEMGKLESMAQKLPSEVEKLRQITMMRKAVEWTAEVVKLAERRYKELYQELRSTTYALEIETGAFRRFWCARGLVGIGRLTGIVEAERKQLADFFLQAEKADAVVGEISRELMEGEVEGLVDRKLEAAILKKEVRWW